MIQERGEGRLSRVRERFHLRQEAQKRTAASGMWALGSKPRGQVVAGRRGREAPPPGRVMCLGPHCGFKCGRRLRRSWHQWRVKSGE